VILPWFLAAVVADLTAIIIALAADVSTASAGLAAIAWLATIVGVSYAVARRAQRPWWDRTPREGSWAAAAVLTVSFAAYVYVSSRGRSGALPGARRCSSWRSRSASRWQKVRGGRAPISHRDHAIEIGQTSD
jgi:hypothetical protein